MATKILVIGETCTDRFIYCTTDRLSPEAPVPVLVPIEEESNGGMSGNVVRNIKSLRDDIEVVHWHQEKQVVKTRLVDKKSNHMFVRIDEGDFGIKNLSLTESELETVKSFDIVIVSDYNKGFLDCEILKQIGKKSKLSILDTKQKITDDVSRCFTFVKLNEREFENNKHLTDLSNLIITLGSEGCKHNNKIYSLSESKETIDVSGAGDTFTSSFILSFYESNDIESSINFANKMASIVVSKKGVSVPFDK